MDFDNFEISLGIRKNGKLIKIKKEKKILLKTLKKHKENTQKLILENIELEKQIEELKDLDKIKIGSPKNKNLEKMLDLSINSEDLDKQSAVPVIIDQEYDINEINFIEKKVQKIKPEIVKINKKSKKIELLENIKKTVIENNTYDELLLSFDYDKINKENFALLNISKKLETIIKTYISNSTIIKEDNELFYDFTNNYKTLKIIAKYYGYVLVLYDINESILDTIDGNKIKTLNFLLYENKIYPLKQKPYKYGVLIPRLNNLISSYVKRDKKRNLRYILLDEVSNYKNYFVKLKDDDNFKYKYLINEVNNKNSENITDETIKIYEYLINNFGLQFYVIENYLKIDKNSFNLDFVSKFGDFIIPDFPKNEYEHLKENKDIEPRNYYYISEKLRIKLYGDTKEKIIEKGKNLDININESEIKKSLTYLDIHDIKTEDDIMLVKEILKDQDFIYYRKKPEAELILATKKINLDNVIDPEYIIELYKKEPINYCKMCNSVLNWKTISIDAINAMFGHVKNNIQLLCLNCNIFKNIRFVGKYSEKSYYYDINSLSKNKLVELLKYHNLCSNGITFTLRQRLDKYIRNLD